MTALPTIELLDAYDGEAAGARIGWTESVVQLVLQDDKDEMPYSIWLTPDGAQAIARDLTEAAHRSRAG